MRRQKQEGHFAMAYALLKALLSGVIVAFVSEVARRNPGAGGLIASLPLVSVLGMIWLWKDAGDAARLAVHSTATFWFLLPSLPIFLLIPALLQRGAGFWVALAAGCLLTVISNLLVLSIGARLGLDL
jgi:hypothetical protein